MTDPTGLTHFDATGAAHMVDVSDKPVTHRVAVARGSVVMTAATLALITSGQATKGDVLGVARQFRPPPPVLRTVPEPDVPETGGVVGTGVGVGLAVVLILA